MNRLQETIAKFNEASPIDPKKLDPEKQKFLTKLGKQSVDTVFDGIHGQIAMLKSDMITGVRFEKKELQKLLRDKNFRWMDVKSVGF